MPVPLQEQWPYTKHHTTICVCVFCFINIGFRIYALQYPMHLWLWIDVRFDGLAVVFLLWSWALALDVIHVKPRRLRTRCVTVDRQNNDVTNFFIQFIFVYNFGCLAMCVAHALCGPAIVFSARKFMFFFYCAHICLPCCLFDNFCLGIDVQTTSHTAYATHTYTLVDAMCECVWFFLFFLRDMLRLNSNNARKPHHLPEYFWEFCDSFMWSTIYLVWDSSRLGLGVCVLDVNHQHCR